MKTVKYSIDVWSSDSEANFRPMTAKIIISHKAFQENFNELMERTRDDWDDMRMEVSTKDTEKSVVTTYQFMSSDAITYLEEWRCKDGYCFK